MKTNAVTNTNSTAELLKKHKFTKDSLAKAEEGALFPGHTQETNDLVTAMFSDAKEEKEYDLLDDTTGLSKTNMEELETLYQICRLNGEDTIYKHVDSDEEVDTCSYFYDVDKDGKTEHSFQYKNGDLISERAYTDDWSAGVVYKDDNPGVNFPYTEIDFRSMTLNDDYTFEETAQSNEKGVELTNYSTGSKVNVEWNEDGSVKKVNNAR